MKYVDLMLLILILFCCHCRAEKVRPIAESDDHSSFRVELGKLAIFSDSAFNSAFDELGYVMGARLTVYWLARSELCSFDEHELLALPGQSFTIGPHLLCNGTLGNAMKQPFHISHLGLLSTDKNEEIEILVAMPDVSYEEEQDSVTELCNWMKTRRGHNDHARECSTALYLARSPMSDGRLIKLVFSTRGISGEPGKLKSLCLSASLTSLDEQARGSN